MRVHNVDFSLSVSLDRKPKDGAHTIMLHGHNIAGHTPASVDRVWFFTGLFVPPVSVKGENVPISSGTHNHSWRRSCLWFFCPQTATNDIIRLIKACKEADTTTRIRTGVLKNVPLLKLTETSFRLDEAKTPPSVFGLDTLTPIETAFMEDCTNLLPRTLFHLSFW
jgi:hypothetical protein